VRPTGWLVACSLTLCLAAWLLATGWAQPRPTLTVAMRHLHRVPDGGADDQRPSVRIGRRIERRSARWTDGWSTALRLVGRSVPEHLGILALVAMVGLVTPSSVLAVLQVSGVVELWVWVPAALSLATAALAAWIVHSDTMARSADVAVDLRHQLGAYLDMVSMLLAGNSGYEGALEQAARAGDGLLFRELRRRMREVATTGSSLVGALELVADDYGVVELEQVAATARLSANEGAPIARTLNAKCATLRSTLAAEQEADARVRTDKVTPPLVGMALLFMALIIYPALDLT
jgi:tight adherence protein C